MSLLLQALEAVGRPLEEYEVPEKSFGSDLLAVAYTEMPRQVSSLLGSDDEKRAGPQGNLRCINTQTYQTLKSAYEAKLLTTLQIFVVRKEALTRWLSNQEAELERAQSIVEDLPLRIW